jgi:hypothetical protein
MNMLNRSLLALALAFGLSACPAPTTNNTNNATNNTPVMKCPEGFMADGQCYKTSEEACAAIGCAADQCLAALSKPPVMSCKTQTKCDNKQTVANGQCFDTFEAACASLGCAADQCLSTRSLPPIAACKPKNQ